MVVEAIITIGGDHKDSREYGFTVAWYKVFNRDKKLEIGFFLQNRAFVVITRLYARDIFPIEINIDGGFGTSI
eukprot:snap_masked-scaffold_13-processed-gene-0.28-mRNA-1 protein AED:1.00 eAED:1.00 QI:0/-1/0/0/-1/1/1/0/72